MKFSLKLVNSDSDISKQILNGLKQQAQSALNKSKQDINDALKSLVKQSIQAEPEYLLHLYLDQIGHFL